MTQTFSNSRSKRVIIVDDDGIHERREGNLVAFICWDELEQLGSRVVRSEHGTKILTGLMREPAREFFSCASGIWKQRYPDREQRNYDRIVRRANWIVFFWCPMFFVVPGLVVQALFWFRGSPESLSPKMEKIHRSMVVGLAYVVLLMIVYSYSRWKAVRCRAGLK